MRDTTATGNNGPESESVLVSRPRVSVGARFLLLGCHCSTLTNYQCFSARRKAGVRTGDIRTYATRSVFRLEEVIDP